MHVQFSCFLKKVYETFCYHIYSNPYRNIYYAKYLQGKYMGLGEKIRKRGKEATQKLWVQNCIFLGEEGKLYDSLA